MAIKTENTSASRTADAQAIGNDLRSGLLKIRNKNHIPALQLQAERSDLPYFGRNNLGGFDAFQSGTTNRLTWYSTTPATIAANTGVEVTECYIEPPIGRLFELNRIDVHVTGDCWVFMVKEHNVRNTTGSANGRISLSGAMDQGHKWMKNADGGTLTWEFPDNDPLVVKYGERVKFYYYRTGTTGINMSLSPRGWMFTNDQDYAAEDVFVGLGDSIIAGTADQYADQNGLFGFAVRNLMRSDGKNVRFVNKGIGGTTAIQWGWMARMGHLDNLRSPLFIVNAGMNDIDIGATGLGAGSPFKSALKDIARAIKYGNPNSPIVFNNISPTDHTGKQTYLPQYRSALVAAVGEIASEGIEAVLADVSNAFLPGSTTDFIATEAIGSHVHPNTTIGQPKMTPIIYNAIKTTSYYN